MRSDLVTSTGTITCAFSHKFNVNDDELALAAVLQAARVLGAATVEAVDVVVVDDRDEDGNGATSR
ncbi:hypothetical protein Pyn_22530 [Prunus yedoensis var. nudiflora]|uniref:Uncharacterized protein n=1 Tax=Prunus yedoensis var. nudiflora TaxID=2094558 RepID=A0A314ZKM0_PRUYE|nr:hypothetical protein Pyn_22530 [Prunus yedoensis var. nudiflora]